MAADQEKISIIIDAVNNASTALSAIKRDLQDLGDGSKKAGSGFDDLQKKMKSVGSSLAQVGAVMTASFTLPIVAGLKSAVDAAVSFEDQLANVRKTTGATVQELDKIGDSLLDMSTSTRTSAEELANIATIGGQMGIAADDVVGFTAAIDKANVALGDEFSGGAEEITQQMGILRNLFSDIKSDDVSTDLLKTSNAINVLGAAGLATGGYVTEAAKRIAGIGVPLGQTSGEVLGLSATMQELGINVERGSTAVGTTLQLMAKDTEGFAKIAGKSTKEFTDLVNTDINGAFIAVLDGIKELNPSTTELATILDDLGVDGRGAGELFLKMASNTDLLREKQDLATEALKNTDSIMGEYNIKNETTAAQLDKLKNNFIILGTTIGKILLPAINAIVERIVPLVQGFAKFAEANPQLVKMGTVVAVLVAALGPLLLILGGITVAVGALLTPVGLVVGGIVAGIAAFTALGVALSQNEAASQALSDIWNNALKPVFQGLYDFISPLVSLVGSLLVGAFRALVDTLSALAGPLELGGRLIGGLFSVVGKTAGVLGNLFVTSLEGTAEGIKKMNAEAENTPESLGLIDRAINDVKESMDFFDETVDKINLSLNRGERDATTYAGAMLKFLGDEPEDKISNTFVGLRDEIINTKLTTVDNIDQMQARIDEFLGIEPTEDLSEQFDSLTESTTLAKEAIAKNLQLITNLAAENSDAFKKSLEEQGYSFETFGEQVSKGLIEPQKALDVFNNAFAAGGDQLDGVSEQITVGIDNIKSSFDDMAVAAKGIEGIEFKQGAKFIPEIQAVADEFVSASQLFEENLVKQLDSFGPGGLKTIDDFYNAVNQAIVSTEALGGSLGGNAEKFKADFKEIGDALAATGSLSIEAALPRHQVDAIIENLQSILIVGNETSASFAASMAEAGISSDKLAAQIASGAISIEDAILVITRAADASKDEIGESFGLIDSSVAKTTGVLEKYGVSLNETADTSKIAARESSLEITKGLLEQQKAAIETGDASKKLAIDMELSNARASLSGQDFSDTYKEVYNKLEDNASKGANEMATANRLIVDGTSKIIGQLKEKLNKAGVDSGQGLASGLKSQLSTVQGAVGLMKGLFDSAGQDAGQGLINGLKSKLSGVIAAATQIAQAAANAAKANLDIQSPSKVFEDIGGDTAAGFALGIQRGTPAVINEINRLSKGTIEEQKELVGLLESALDFEGGAGITRGGQVVDTFSSFEDAIGKVKDALKDLDADTNEFMESYTEVALEASKAWSGFEPPEGIVDTYDELNEGLGKISDNIKEAVDSHEDFVAEAQKGLDDYGTKLEAINKKFEDLNKKFDEMAEKSASQAGGEIGDAVVDALEKEKKLNEDILAVKSSITEKEIEIAGIISEGGDSSNALKSLETEKEKLSVLESQKTTVEQLIAQYAEINNNAGQLTEKLEQNAEATTKAEEALAKLQSNSKASTDQITAQQEKINALKQEELILIGKQIISQQSLEEANAKIQDAKERANLSEIDYIALNLAREQQAIEEKRKLEMAAKEQELLALKEIQTVQEKIIEGKIGGFDTSTLTTQDAIDLANKAIEEEEAFKGKLAAQIALLNEYKATEETIYAEQKAELELQQAEFESFILASYDTIIAKLEELRKKAIETAAAQSKVKGGGFSQGGFTGFDKGGFTGAGNLKDVAGFVHKGEWVGPNWMVKRFAPLFKNLEGIRQGRMAGFEEGGMVGGAALPAQNTFNQPITINPVVQGNVDFNQWANYLSWKMRTG